MKASPSKFAAQCVGIANYPPPTKYAEGQLCWLCGGETDGKGWPLRDAIAPTFTHHNQAKTPSSDAVCQWCVAMSRKDSWESYVDTHPEENLKTGYAMSWRSYSHVFHSGGHESPTRERWRDWFLDPPEPPFMFVVATSGQKHLIFRGVVSHNRSMFLIRFEEDLILYFQPRFAAILEDFEALYALGFSKDSILSGNYHPGQLMKIGVAVWEPLESKMQQHRLLNGQLLKLVHFCAQKQEGA